jgi:acetyl esterase/lipase
MSSSRAAIGSSPLIFVASGARPASERAAWARAMSRPPHDERRPFGHTRTVPWLFLGAAAVGALFTLNALRPVRRFWLLQGPGFFASWFTGELAPHHLFWQALATVAFLWFGALHVSPGGAAWEAWAALGLVAASWGGLVLIIVEAGKAEATMERALREALGDGYRAEIPPDLAERLDEPFHLRQRLLPLPVVDGRVERVRGIVFSHAGGRDLKLDVYRRRGSSGRCPTLLQLHGGAWMIGRRDEQGLPLMLRLAAHGWVCISSDYRLSPRATFPDHLIDVKAAIRWIREHGAEYGADPDFLVLTGGSAGGHLAALAALTPGDPSYQPGFEDVDTRVQACVPFYGVYDFTDRNRHFQGSLLLPMLERAIMKRTRAEALSDFERASPMSRVTPDAPPFLIIHGARDTLVPVEEARAFAALLRATSRSEVAYAEVPGAQHAFEVFPSVRTGHAIRGVERFLSWVYARHRTRAAGADREGGGRLCA